MPDEQSNQIVPIGALFSGSLIFNNLAYTTLSVPFIQMYLFFSHPPLSLLLTDPHLTM